MHSKRHLFPYRTSEFRKAMQQPGRRLAPGLQIQLERIFAIQLHDLRICEGDAAKLAGVRAFASGRTIFFAPACFNLKTGDGLRLLGHELAHVKQQRDMNMPAEFTLLNDSLMEAEADSWGHRLNQTWSGYRAPALSSVDGENTFSTVMQCASSAFGVVSKSASYIGSLISWGWNSLPALSGSQPEINQTSIQSKTDEINLQTALKRQEHSDVPIHVPPNPPPPRAMRVPASITPPAQPEYEGRKWDLSTQAEAAAIEKLTAAENMRRADPLHLYLRNAILRRNPNGMTPPQASELEQARSGLTPVDTRETTFLPYAQAAFKNAAELKAREQKTDDFHKSNYLAVAKDKKLLGTGIGQIPGAVPLSQRGLKPATTTETALFDDLPAAYKQQIEAKKLAMFQRIAQLKVPIQAVNDVLRDPVIKVLQDAVTSSYRAKPENDLTNFDYDRLLVALAALEDRVKESQEIVGLLSLRTAGRFFEIYFDNTITQWAALHGKLDERNSVGNRLTPKSLAIWDSIYNEYIGTPRNKAQIIERLANLVAAIEQEVIPLTYAQMSRYERGFVRKLSSGTGSWDCRIVITADAWKEILPHGSDTILGILTQNPIPIQSDGKTKGNRAIKPEPYGWIFSTSDAYRLVADIAGRAKWPPSELNFNRTQKVH